MSARSAATTKLRLVAAILLGTACTAEENADGRRYFEGDDCMMCTPPWTNPQRKNGP
jgi:hypothetical protein